MNAFLELAWFFVALLIRIWWIIFIGPARVCNAVVSSLAILFAEALSHVFGQNGPCSIDNICEPDSIALVIYTFGFGAILHAILGARD